MQKEIQYQCPNLKHFPGFRACSLFIIKPNYDGNAAIDNSRNKIYLTRLC